MGCKRHHFFGAHLYRPQIEKKVKEAAADGEPPADMSPHLDLVRLTDHHVCHLRAHIVVGYAQISERLADSRWFENTAEP